MISSRMNFLKNTVPFVSFPPIYSFYESPETDAKGLLVCPHGIRCVSLHWHSGLVSFQPPWVQTRLGEPTITAPGAEHW